MQKYTTSPGPAAHGAGKPGYTGPTWPAGDAKQVFLYCEPCGLEYFMQAGALKRNPSFSTCAECGKPLTKRERAQ